MHRNRVLGEKTKKSNNNEKQRKNFTLEVVTKDHHTSDNFISKI